MKINLIIGAGQLGSRHLQGMLNWKGEQKIYVVDPFETSLNSTFERSKEVNHEHELIFTKDLKDIPENIDLAIIATQSNVREKIITNLFLNTSIKYLILEKVLFQEIDSFYRVNELLKNTKTWVNHPRRMFPYYQKLRNQVSMSTANKHFSVFGSNWGMACNALHFIDLICFLSKSKVKNISTENIDSEILKSKRDGYIEFTGLLNGTLENGDTFVIISKSGEASPATINVNHQNEKQLIILEGNLDNKISVPDESNALIQIETFPIEFQSSLTTRICQDLFDNGKSMLPTYQEASESHIAFIQVFLELTNKIMKTKLTKLPIT